MTPPGGPEGRLRRAQPDGSPVNARARATAAAAAAALCVALLGGLATDVGPWYQGLEQPPWKPPDWAFGPAWTLIFALTALAGVEAWRAAPDAGGRRRVVALFALNGILNVGWSLLFFRLQRPDWALVEVAGLWLSVAWLMVVFGSHCRRVAWLLLPYLLWVSFAAALNLAVVRLNGPFGGG